MLVNNTVAPHVERAKAIAITAGVGSGGRGRSTGAERQRGSEKSEAKH
jgi:hypothetical protein